MRNASKGSMDSSALAGLLTGSIFHTVLPEVGLFHAI